MTKSQSPRTQSAAAGSLAREPADGPDLADAALDALAEATLRMTRESLGLFDQQEQERLARDGELWASHLRVLTASPAAAASDPGHRSTRRDWLGLRRFLSGLRARERDVVSQRTQDAQEVAWAFVRCLGQIAGSASTADGAVMGRVERLAEAAKGRTLEELRAEVAEVATAIREDIEVRKSNQAKVTAELSSRISALTEELHQVKREASLDGLTGLANRRAFDQHIQRVSELSRVLGKPVSLAFLDVDHFKRVNDTWGHPAGDAVLRTLADTMVRQFVRKTDFLARSGGEEFAVILFETDVRAAQAPAERFMKAVRALHFSSGGKEWSITVSIGLAQLAPDEDPKAWMQRADQALYAAKREGRDRVVVARAVPTTDEGARPIPAPPPNRPSRAAVRRAGTTSPSWTRS